MYDPNFDTSTLEAIYADKKQVRVGCNVGYSGFFKLICDDGTWKKRGKQCERKFCPFAVWKRNVFIAPL